MSLLTDIFFNFVEGLFSVDRDDPFDGYGRPYHGDGLMSDDEYRDYIRAHNANQLSGVFNHRTGMFDDGLDLAGIYDDNNWLPGPIGAYDD